MTRYRIVKDSRARYIVQRRWLWRWLEVPHYTDALPIESWISLENAMLFLRQDQRGVNQPTSPKDAKVIIKI